MVNYQVQSHLQPIPSFLKVNNMCDNEKWEWPGDEATPYIHIKNFEDEAVKLTFLGSAQGSWSSCEP